MLQLLEGAVLIVLLTTRHWKWLIFFSSRQLKNLDFEELQMRLSALDPMMEREIEELRQRYTAKRQPILDAMDAKKRRQQNFWVILLVTFSFCSGFPKAIITNLLEPDCCFDSLLAILWMKLDASFLGWHQFRFLESTHIRLVLTPCWRTVALFWILSSYFNAAFPWMLLSTAAKEGTEPWQLYIWNDFPLFQMKLPMMPGRKPSGNTQANILTSSAAGVISSAVSDVVFFSSDFLFSV